MSQLTPSANPALTTTLPALTVNSVAHPDTWNPTHQTLLDNDAFLDAAIKGVDARLTEELDDMGERVSGIEATSSVAVQTAVGLDWLYRGNTVSFELFTTGYTLVDFVPVAIVSGVGGDDSIDIASTASVRAFSWALLSVAENTRSTAR